MRIRGSYDQTYSTRRRKVTWEVPSINSQRADYLAFSKLANAYHQDTVKGANHQLKLYPREKPRKRLTRSRFWFGIPWKTSHTLSCCLFFFSSQRKETGDAVTLAWPLLRGIPYLRDIIIGSIPQKQSWRCGEIMPRERGVSGIVVEG